MNKEKQKKYMDEILAVIKRENIYSVVDIFAFYGGCKRETFYAYELHKSDKIKQAIANNRIKTIHSLKAKWANSDNATLQIALFKTICNNEDRKCLSQTYQEVDMKGVEIKGIKLYDRD